MSYAIVGKRIVEVASAPLGDALDQRTVNKLCQLQLKLYRGRK